MRYRHLLLLVCVVILALHGCAKKTAVDEKVLAKVSNRVITVKDLNAKIARVPAYYQGVVEKNKKRYLDESIVEMLFYEEAIRIGIDKDKETKEVINEAKKKIIIAKFIKQEVEDKVKVSEKEMRLYYDEHKDEFKSPELWRASHILVGTEEAAKGIQAVLAKGEKFEDLARKYSTDATANRGGDVGYFRMGQLVPDFENACAKLNVGETSDILRTQFGYHVIKLTDKKEPAIEDFDKVKPAVENELKRTKRSELFDKLVMDLKKKYGVQIEEDVYKYLDTPEKAGQQAAR
jgi:peptidyl-prolyl cis-trans isomerase C